MEGKYANNLACRHLKRSQRACAGYSFYISMLFLDCTTFFSSQTLPSSPWKLLAAMTMTAALQGYGHAACWSPGAIGLTYPLTIMPGATGDGWNMLANLIRHHSGQKHCKVLHEQNLTVAVPVVISLLILGFYPSPPSLCSKPRMRVCWHKGEGDHSSQPGAAVQPALTALCDGRSLLHHDHWIIK